MPLAREHESSSHAERGGTVMSVLRPKPYLSIVSLREELHVQWWQARRADVEIYASHNAEWLHNSLHSSLPSTTLARMILTSSIGRSSPLVLTKPIR